MLMVAILLISNIPTTITAAQEEKTTTNVVYLDGTITTEGDGSAPDQAVKTMKAAYEALGNNGGTVVLCGNVTMSYSTQNSEWPTSDGAVTITGKYGGTDYNATLTILNERNGALYILFKKDTTFENIHIDAQATQNSPANEARAVEFWAGKKLTFGEGVTTTMDGGKEITQNDANGNYYKNGRFCVRVGSYNGEVTNATFVMKSGTISWAQGGNNKNAVTNSTIEIGGSAKIVDFLQVGGTGKNITKSNVTINGATINDLYINGHGAAENGDITITATNATIKNIYGQRANDNGKITGTATVTLNGCTVETIDVSSPTINKLDMTLTNTKTGAGAAVQPTKGSNITEANLIVDGETIWPATDQPEPDPEPEEPPYTGPVGTLTEVYVDAAAAADGNGSKEKPLTSLENAYKALKAGEEGTIHIVGEYVIEASYQFPTHDKMVTITGDGTGSIYFNSTSKVLVHFLTAVKLENLTWKYSHKSGNMDIYAGQELYVGEGVTFACVKDGAMGTNCIAIRGGYYSAEIKAQSGATSSNTKISMYSGTISYLMGGNNGAHVGNVEINFGGTATLTSRLQVGGVSKNVENVKVNITGGTINDFVMIAYGTNGSVAKITGDSVINITGGQIGKIITNRTGYEKHEGNMTMNIGGKSNIGSIALDKSFLTEGKSYQIIFDHCEDVKIGDGFGDGWSSITVKENQSIAFSGTYNSSTSGTAVLKLEDGAQFKLTSCANEIIVPDYVATGAEKTGKVVKAPSHNLVKVEAKAPSGILGGCTEHYRCANCDCLFADETGNTKTTLAEVTIAPEKRVEYDTNYTQDSNFAVTKLMTTSGGQGNSIYGNTLVCCDNKGNCNMYDLVTGNLIASFQLGSYNSGTLPDDAERAEGTAAGNWTNHSNQVMFGPAKFDESDPLPLLYVTTGNSGAHDGTGAYIAKCAVERIRQKENGEWYAETVQIIEFNDWACIPDQDGNPNKNMNTNGTSDTLINMYNAETGKFMYVDDPTTAVDESKWQKIGWGWPASFVDSDPTEKTAGKFYLYSARYRTTAEYEENNRTVYGNGDANWNYYNEGVNAYIITEFNLPALPTSESDPNYGGTVTLYAKDILDQFETEYEIGVTQGGTMYRGRIYYSYGWNGEATNLYKRNGIQVFDIAQKKIVAKLALYNHEEIQPTEPECCSIWNGHLVLGVNGSGYRIFVFDYVALDDAVTEDATCTENGGSYIVCSLCGHHLKTISTEKAHHDLEKVDAVAATTEKEGNIAHWLCKECGKYFADKDGAEELTAEQVLIPKLDPEPTPGGEDDKTPGGDEGDKTSGGDEGDKTPGGDEDDKTPDDEDDKAPDVNDGNQKPDEDDKTTPSTGDDMTLVMAMTTLLTAAAGLWIVIMKRQNRKVQ